MDSCSRRDARRENVFGEVDGRPKRNGAGTEHCDSVGQSKGRILKTLERAIAVPSSEDPDTVMTDSSPDPLNLPEIVGMIPGALNLRSLLSAPPVSVVGEYTHATAQASEEDRAPIVTALKTAIVIHERAERAAHMSCNTTQLWGKNAANEAEYHLEQRVKYVDVLERLTGVRYEAGELLEEHEEERWM